MGALVSRDSKTDAWTRKTFTPEYREQLARTIYVTANPFSRLLDPDSLAGLDEVWRYAWDEEAGTVLPRPVTDRTIAAARERDPDRLLVHYLQPHVPFVLWERRTALGKGNFGLDAESVPDAWVQLRNGDLTRAAVRAAYRENLEFVLADVALLLENVDAGGVAITADHGNGFGEWGVFGHPIHMPFRCVRAVPWVETAGTDERTREPADYDATDRGDVDEKLRALGYR